MLSVKVLRLHFARVRQGSGYKGCKRLVCCSEPSQRAFVVAVIVVSPGFRSCGSVVCRAGDAVSKQVMGVHPQGSFNPIENGGTAERAVLASSPTSAS